MLHIIKPLSKYLPDNALDYCAELLTRHHIQLYITAERKTKIGDYRPQKGTFKHRITINYSLNQYAFLITFLHEVAHAITFEKYKNLVYPHGEEWKQSFREVAQPLLKTEVFPTQILFYFQKYLQNPRAATFRDEQLYRAVSLFNNTNLAQYLVKHLADLPENTIFKIANDATKTFQKGKILRKYAICQELKTQKKYRIHQHALVEEIKKEGRSDNFSNHE